MILPLIKSLRPSQWAKNSFVLAPLVFARKLGDPVAVEHGLLALLAFCLASSAVYLGNDLRDREEDRKHPLKKDRPLASGALSAPAAVVALVALLVAAGGVGYRLGPEFSWILGGYLLLNVLYTGWFKRMVILDVMSIALGFVLRVEAGARAVPVVVSSWLLLCTIFVALFLAFSKRRHEITLLQESASEQRKVLDQYSPAFLDQMINVVTASTVVSYALYAVSAETVEKYHSEHLVYTVPLVLFGIFRYLYLMYQLADRRSPTDAILRDPPFLINIALWGLAVVWVVYGG